MNIDQANNLDLEDLLGKLGHTPVSHKHGGDEVWYYSPFRKEKEASFHIRKGKVYDWVWHDFGSGEGTTVLDFVRKYENLTTKEALAYLDDLYPNYKTHLHTSTKLTSPQTLFSFPPQSPPQAGISKNEKSDEIGEFEFIKTMPITSVNVLSYLNSRRIPREVAQTYFRLIQYRRRSDATQRLYFGFGMQNESGGWEVRSASDEPNQIFKVAVPTKDISFIKGREQGRGVVSIFEGQMDFVSLLAMFGTNELKGDAIILHGLELYARAVHLIHQNAYEHINLFLDNNKAGHEKAALFKEEFGDRVKNQSPNFLPHVDLNDALRNKFTPTFTATPHPPQP